MRRESEAVLSRTTTGRLAIGMFVGVVLGGLLGKFVPELMLAIEFIGRLFFNALVFVAIPFMIANVIVGMAGLGDLRKIGRSGWRVLFYIVGSSMAAILIAVGLGLLVQPGAGISLPVIPSGGATAADVVRFVNGMAAIYIPGNLFGSLEVGHYVGLIFLALFVGGASVSIGTRGRSLLSFFGDVQKVMQKLTGLLLYVAPVGLFSLTGAAIARSESSAGQIVATMGMFTWLVVAGLIVQAVIVLPVILKVMAGRSIFKHFRDFTPAIGTALGSASSMATLPVTMDCADTQAAVDTRASAYMLPLGSVVNMNGTALFVALGAIFLAQAVGVPLGFGAILILIATSFFVALAAPGIPSSSLILFPIVLGAIGFSAEQVMAATGLLFATEWLLDRLRTAVNVWSDACGAAVLAETFEFKTARRAPASGRESRPTRSTTDRGTRSGSSSAPRTRTRTTGRGRTDAAPTRSRPPARTSTPRTSAPRGRATTDDRKIQRSPFEITGAGAPVLDRESAGTPNQAPAERAEAGSRPAANRSTASRGPATRRTRTTTRTSSERTPAAASRTSRPSVRRPTKPAEPTPKVEAAPPKVERPAAEVRPVAQATRAVVVKPAVEATPAVEVKPVEVVEAAASKPTISPETIARELAKVSEQLSNSISTPVAAAPKPEAVAPVVQPVREEPAEVRTPQVEPTPPTPAVTEKPTPEAREEAAPEPSEPTFGRGNQRKGLRPKAAPKTESPAVAEKVEPAEVKAPVSVPAAEVEAPTEDASFGRTRKKRTR